MKKRISNFIVSLDLLGRTISFEENEEQTVKHFFTGILTILMLIIITVLSYFFGKELWERKRISSFLNEIKVVNTEYEMKEFPVLFSLTTENLKSINKDLDVYDIAIQSLFYINPTTDFIYNLIQEECDISQFPKRFQIQLESLMILFKARNLIPLCFPFKPETKTISSNSQTLDYTNLILRIFNCSDDKKLGGNKFIHSKPLKKCDTETVIQPNFRILIYFLSNFIDVSNETNPLEIDRIIRNIRVDSQFLTQIDFFISSLQLKSDNGWIIEDTKIFDALFLSEFRGQYQFTDNSNGRQLFSGIFQTTNNIRIISRTYLKIQDLLATIGGMFNGILLALKILTYDFSIYNYYKNFEIFKLQILINNKKNANTEINKSQLPVKKNLICNNFEEDINENLKEKNNIEDIIKQVNQYSSPKKIKIDENFGMLNYLNKVQLNNIPEENFNALREENYVSLNNINNKKLEAIKFSSDLIKVEILSNSLNFYEKPETEIKDYLEELIEVNYFKYFWENYICCCSRNKNVIFKEIISSKSKKKFAFKEYLKIYCSFINKENN